MTPQLHIKAVGRRLFCFYAGKFARSFLPVCEWKAQLRERPEESGRSGVLPKGLLAEKSPQLHIKAVGRRLFFVFVRGSLPAVLPGFATGKLSWESVPAEKKML